MHPGVLVALAAYFFFCICDACIKAIGPQTSVFQTLFFVTLFSFIPVLAFTLRHDPLSAMFKMNQPWLVMGRVRGCGFAHTFGCSCVAQWMPPPTSPIGSVFIMTISRPG